MLDKVIFMYQDDGHAWGRVRISELLDLGIADKISDCSYINAGYAYLEEDVDMSLYCKAIIAKGIPFTFRTLRYPGECFIRDLPRYSVEAVTQLRHWSEGIIYTDIEGDWLEVRDNNDNIVCRVLLAAGIESMQELKDRQSNRSIILNAINANSIIMEGLQLMGNPEANGFDADQMQTTMVQHIQTVFAGANNEKTLPAQD